ncbi:MAG: TolC family protein [Ignavibacteriae bacterium]|nr:MAG: TolC family protein [Ignavibacteriota bacterium]
MMKNIIFLLFLFFVYKNIVSQDKLPQTLSLSDVEKMAIQYNPALKKGDNRILSAEGRYLTGVSPQMPELSLSYDFVPAGSSLGNYEERSIEINQSIEFPLKLIHKGKKLNNEINIIASENDITSLNIINNVRRAYIILLQKQALIKIAEENYSVASEFKSKSSIRFDVGEATNLEKLTADVQHAQALNNLETLKNEYLIALSDMLYSVGIKQIYSDYNPVLLDSLTFKYFDESLESVIQISLKTNPLLTLSELRKNGAVMNRKIAISSFLPDLTIGYKRQSISGINNYYGINLGISLPLWFMFDQKGKVKEADAEIKVSEYEYDEIYLDVVNSTKKAYISLKNSEKQILLYKNTLLPESEEIFRIASTNYEIGEITYLEFLQSKQILITTKENYISALSNFNLNLIELEKALGRKLF